MCWHYARVLTCFGANSDIPWAFLLKANWVAEQNKWAPENYISTSSSSRSCASVIHKTLWSQLPYLDSHSPSSDVTHTLKPQAAIRRAAPALRFQNVCILAFHTSSALLHHHHHAPFPPFHVLPNRHYFMSRNSVHACTKHNDVLFVQQR